ncbi:MAG: ornithine--oxo-acid transaminase [Patescibacteria group bacterium]
MKKIKIKKSCHINLTETYCAHNYHPLPVVIHSGLGSWVWDEQGNKYLDMLCAYSAVNQGHLHPHIKKAAQEQINKLTISSRAFYNDQLGRFAQKVCQITGKESMLPMNAGTEAVETALKVARKWGNQKKGVSEGSQQVVVCSNNFHGRTITIISMSSDQQYRKGFGPFTGGFVQIPFGDHLALEKALNKNTVAFLFEPIQGEGGIIIPPHGYLKKVRNICSKYNILMIADEIQTGLGRTGNWFACDHESVIPDIYILGKALSGGFYPVSAIAANRDIMEVITPGDHGSTFGGNPLASAIGIAALEVIESENLVQRAAETGTYFRSLLDSLRSSHVKEVRSKGLMIGLEIHRSSGTAMKYCYRLMERGLLCKDTHSQTIRFAPALGISKDEIEWAFEQIQAVLED